MYVLLYVASFIATERDNSIQISHTQLFFCCPLFYPLLYVVAKLITGVEIKGAYDMCLYQIEISLVPSMCVSGSRKNSSHFLGAILNDHSKRSVSSNLLNERP